MKYEKFDILKKAEFSTNNPEKEIYIVHIECDANDGDCLCDTLTFSKQRFEEDELFLLVLSYVSKYTGKFSSEKGSYGHHVAENKDFPWLEDYLILTNILIFAGMCDQMCNSVSNVEIKYYDNSGECYYVKLPDIDNLFENKKEFTDYLNKLYLEYYNELE